MFLSSSSEGVRLAYEQRNVAKTHVETGEVDVCVPVAGDTVCFTVQFMYAEQHLCGRSERVTVPRG